MAGSAAGFDGMNWLSTSGSQLSLGDGRVTLSAWVYPVNSGTDADTYAQGILGHHRSEADAYPYLDRQGLKIEFGFSDGTTDRRLITDNDVLALNAWNHVVATFGVDDKVARIYVNGNLVKQDASAFLDVTRIASTQTLDIGRASDYGDVIIGAVDVNENGSFRCGGGSLYCISLNGKLLLRLPANNCDQTYTGVMQPNANTFREIGTLAMWKVDGLNDDCGNAKDDNDDKCTLSPRNALYEQ